MKRKTMSNTKVGSKRERKSASFADMMVGGLDNAEAALRILDDSLSEALVDTFPASDPISSLRFD